MRDFSDDLSELRRRVEGARAYMKVAEARARIEELEVEVSKPDLWDDQDRARAVNTELSQLQEDVTLVDQLDGTISDLETLAELAREEGDDSIEEEIRTGLAALGRQLDNLELRALFTGEYDDRDAIVTVNSGAGGTDAQDWTNMLLRMYLRWAEAARFRHRDRRGVAGHRSRAQLRDLHDQGSVRVRAARERARRAPAHPHLAVRRQRPSSDRVRVVRRACPRSTSTEVPEIDPTDLRIDTYRSSGAGGQHVNVTDSAVRITHLPTGVVVSCQNERSQTQNKARAMQILAARLAELQRQERDAELLALSGDKRDVAFGSQIRTYTLHPYQLVKDERTRHETGNVQAVLDGELDAFIESYLQWRRQQA